MIVVGHGGSIVFCLPSLDPIDLGEVAEMADRMERWLIQQRLERVEATLDSLISWMAQSANNTITHEEAQMLLRQLDGKK